MYATFQSTSLHGVDALEITVEVDASNGMPSFQIGGLGDSAIKESKQRVVSATKNSGFKIPPSRITVNLAPADLKKEGSNFDLPIALGLLLATGQIEITTEDRYLVLGELALDGSVRRVPGVLPAALLAKRQGLRGVIVPTENTREACVVEGIEVIGVTSLQQSVAYVTGAVTETERAETSSGEIDEENYSYPIDFEDIKGQEGVKRALTIAAAGGHNLLCIGPPGSGKTMSARAVPSILPSQSTNEMLETTKIYSVSGLLSQNESLVKARPFRAPHHSISEAGLVGGGTNPLPGEVSLAHNGVLFLDELTEFNRKTLESLRQPLEDKHVTISRARRTATYPSNTMLLAAMNPCPCGHYGSSTTACSCNSNQIQTYLSKISGPLLDRIDIHIEAPDVKKEDLLSDAPEESSATIRTRVEEARSIQRNRFHKTNLNANADMGTKEVKRFCKLDAPSQALLERMFDTLSFSARSYNKVLKISRTIADLDKSKKIQQNHLLEAIQYRNLDRKYWS